MVDTDKRLTPGLVEVLERSRQPVPAEIAELARSAGAAKGKEDRPLSEEQAAQLELRMANRENQKEAHRLRKERGRN